MSIDNAKLAEVNAQTSVKKNRRGVSNKTKAVAQLRFHEKDAANNMLFVGHLEEAKVEWSTNADGKQFTGMSVPRIVLHFSSNHINANERRHIYRNILPVESNVNTIPGGIEEWKVNNVFNWIKHILDVYYLKGREFTEEEEDALTLSFDDMDDNGEYVAIDPEEVIAGYRHIFDNAVAMLNGSWNLADGEVAKPVYKTADGKFIPVWLKLLRHKKRKNEWVNVGQNGELDFDNFIGNGVIEIIKKDCPPAVLRVDLAKESITPKETNKTPNIGVPGLGTAIGGVMAGPAMPDMGVGSNSAFADAAGDMPF